MPHPPRPAPDVTAIILCGGAGTRMAGEDKGLVPLLGKPLVAHVAAVIAPQVENRVLINANRNAVAYSALGYPVFADDLPGHAGPLAGIAAGMARVATRYTLVVPCDTPGLPMHLVQGLRAAMQDHGTPFCCAHDGHRAQVLHCLLETSLAGPLQSWLAGGGRAMRDWIDSLPSCTADFSADAAAFQNCNTREDLDRWALAGAEKKP